MEGKEVGVDSHSKSTDTNVGVGGEGRLVSFRYTRLTLVQSSAPGVKLVSSL